MSLEITCVYCRKPLLDSAHAIKHVAEQCDASPQRALGAEIQRLKTLVAILVLDAKGNVRIPFATLESPRELLLNVTPDMDTKELVLEAVVVEKASIQ